jgi:hypothetical protein
MWALKYHFIVNEVYFIGFNSRDLIKKRTVIQKAIRQYEIQLKLFSITVIKFLKMTSYIQWP